MKYSELKGKEYKIILRVEWYDAASDWNQNWLHKDNLHKIELEKCINWGCLVHVDDKSIILVPALADGDYIYGRFIIPESNIISIKQIDVV